MNGITKALPVAFVLSTLFLFAADAWAASTYTAASCNQSDVNAVINGPTHIAVDGDVIQIPAGSCTWSSGITVPSGIGITIQGNGTPDTGASTTGASASCSATAITISGAVAFAFTPSYGHATARLSCMAMNWAADGSAAFTALGSCTASGCPNLRIDNITFNNWSNQTPGSNGLSYALSGIGNMFGVIDHNTVNGSSSAFRDFTELQHANYLGVGSWGDNSWVQPENYGSQNFTFFENNVFNYVSVGDNEAWGETVTVGGGRVVARYNTFRYGTNGHALSWHGTESGGRVRSGRTWEFYGNTMNVDTGTQALEAVGARGGTGLTWGNTANFSSSGMNILVELDTYRALQSFSPWGPCDGSSGFDTNDGVVYYSGTIASFSGNTVTVNGSPGWATNYWTAGSGPAPLAGGPYSVHDVSTGDGSEIRSNGSNTLTVQGWTGNNFAAGDSIQILRATRCIDQAGGRGTGIMYDAQCQIPAGINYRSCTAASANQIASPAYAWSSTTTGGSLGLIYADTARVIANRDYYIEANNQAAQISTVSPFNGASGMGHGTLANRPTSCTAGVGYWATDSGPAWNNGSVGGQLFVCTASGWSLYYTPYTYPHPLTGTVTATPAPPTNLQAVTQ